MKNIFLSLVVIALASCSTVESVDARDNVNIHSNASDSPLHQKDWIHGSPDCNSNADPAIDVFQYDLSSYVLRQNKCLSFEAPFIYVLFGEDKVVVLDTGATADQSEFPLYETVRSLIEEQVNRTGKSDMEVLVIHSHSHSDHYTGDAQFQDKANVTVVGTKRSAINAFFAFGNDNENVYLDLGGRKLTVIPTPGHQEEAITIYDPKTRWLLTGDTFYPGVIYVKHWKEYKDSVARLAIFANEHEVSAILGAHIEMMNIPGEYYPIGTLYQPNEASLPLQTADLTLLDAELKRSKRPKKIMLNNLLIEPMGMLQKLLSNASRWILQ